MMKARWRVVGGLVGLVVAFVAGGRIYYSELLSGPELAPPDATISLKSSFPPPPGWAESLVEGARALADSLPSSAVIVLLDGHVVAEWGLTERRSDLHSMRKSLVRALYGIAVAQGLIDLNHTLAELGVDDINPPLTDLEKTGCLGHLLAYLFRYIVPDSHRKP